MKYFVAGEFLFKYINHVLSDYNYDLEEFKDENEFFIISKSLPKELAIKILFIKNIKSNILYNIYYDGFEQGWGYLKDALNQKNLYEEKPYPYWDKGKVGFYYNMVFSKKAFDTSIAKVHLFRVGKKAFKKLQMYEFMY